ncbi:MAG: TIGR02757 family protein [Flavobacteriales bacterium]
MIEFVNKYKNIPSFEVNDDASLKALLDEAVEKYNRTSFIETDPISVPHQFQNKEDIEIAAYFAATIAWGQRSTLIRNAMNLMERMDMSPFMFVMEASSSELKSINGFVHRTLNSQDCTGLILRLRNGIKANKSFENMFFNDEKDVRKGILKFRQIMADAKPASRELKHISNPETGSAAKRLNMMLRWLVRKDQRGVDFGLWTAISPSKLIIPLDVHSGSVARLLGLLKRSANDWTAAEQLTKRLRDFDATDPVKYDFALFGLGAFDKVTHWPIP